MIRLNISSELGTSHHIFDKNTITIGTSHQSETHLNISKENISNEHISITKHDDHYTISNLTADESLTLNGYTFSETEIVDGDIIEIDDTSILFEEVAAKGIPHDDISIEDVMKEAEKILAEEPASISDKDNSHNEEFHKEPSEEDLEALFKSIMDNPDEESSPENIPYDEGLEEITPEAPEEDNIDFDIDKILKDIEELSQENVEEEKNEHIPPPAAKKILTYRFAIIMLVLLLISIFFGIGFYMSIQKKNSHEEFIVSQQLADISMAIAHAKIQATDSKKPSEINMYSPSFLKNHMEAVLPSQYISSHPLDDNRLIKNTSYSLSIVTNKGMTQFLVIATPESTLLQKIIPKSSLIIDSTTMKLHRMLHPKEWHNILGDEDTLDSVSPMDIAKIAHKEEIIFLKALDNEEHSLGFTPPESLSSLCPGAVNAIYNAPRYFPFTEELIQKASQVELGIGNDQDITSLKELCDSFSHFNNMAIYSKNSLQTALNAYSALDTHIPEIHFYIGRLSFHQNTGDISDASLLTQDLIATHRNTIEQFATKRPTSDIPKEEPIDIREGIEQLIDDSEKTDREFHLREFDILIEPFHSILSATNITKLQNTQWKIPLKKNPRTQQRKAWTSR